MNKKCTVDKYVKPNDILMALIAPKIDEVFKVKYKNVVWNPGNITNVALEGNSDGKGWFEVEMYIHVGERIEAKLDEIKLRIDIPERNYYTIKDQNH